RSSVARQRLGRVSWAWPPRRRATADHAAVPAARLEGRLDLPLIFAALSLRAPPALGVLARRSPLSQARRLVCKTGDRHPLARSGKVDLSPTARAGVAAEGSDERAHQGAERRGGKGARRRGETTPPPPPGPAGRPARRALPSPLGCRRRTPGS